MTRGTPGAGDLALGFGALAALMILVLLILIWRRPGTVQAPTRKVPRRPVVIDGSNVMHWQDGVPSLEPVQAAIRVLQARGYDPGVIFDANVGYKIADRYHGDRALARMLGLPVDRVLVVPKGVVADEYILKAAQAQGTAILTNDRYRDWADQFPEVAAPGKLIRGGWRDGDVWMDA